MLWSKSPNEFHACEGNTEGDTELQCGHFPVIQLFTVA